MAKLKVLIGYTNYIYISNIDLNKLLAGNLKDCNKCIIITY